MRKRKKGFFQRAKDITISLLTAKDRLDHKLGERFDMESMDPIHDFLQKYCSQTNIETYFEVGTSEGKSLKTVVKYSKNLKKIGSCDIWGDKYGGTARGSHKHIEEILEELEYKGEIQFFDGDSHKILPTLMHHEDHFEKYDLVLVDGDHSLEGNRQDLIECWPMVKPGGCIIFDDITHPKHLFLEEVFDIWVEENINDITAHAKYKDHHGWAIARKAVKEDKVSGKENIKRKIRSIKSFLTNENLEKSTKLEKLKDAFKDQTCYILSCGPSIGDVDQMALKMVCDTSLIASVKQAGLISGIRTDIQLFNCCNVTNYPSFPGTIYVGQADGLPEKQAKSQFWPRQEVNLTFQVSGNTSAEAGKELKNTLVDHKRFDEWTIENSKFNRPFGPGIMYETVFFLVKYLGVSKIRTIGWDFQDPTETESWVHFYEDSNRENLLNPSVKPYPNEAKNGIELSKHLYDWLNDQGVKLEVMESEFCHVHSDIPRFKITASNEQQE